MQKITIPLYIICLIGFFISAIVFYAGGNIVPGTLTVVAGACFLVALSRYLRSHKQK